MANPYFNANYYLANNPDVFAAGINTVEAAWAHYEQNGAREALNGAEARKPAPWFDISYYLSQNSDLATAGLSPAQLFEHFTTYGISEGRAPSAAAESVDTASLTAYAAANEDLRIAFGIEEGAEPTEAQLIQLAQHFYQYGYQEGREGSPAQVDVNPGETFTLTTGVDTFAGTDGNDTINAFDHTQAEVPATTLTLNDSIDGGAGTDTLNLVASEDHNRDLVGTVKNVEVINVKGSDYVGSTATKLQLETLADARDALVEAEAALVVAQADYAAAEAYVPVVEMAESLINAAAIGVIVGDLSYTEVYQAVLNAVNNVNADAATKAAVLDALADNMADILDDVWTGPEIDDYRAPTAQEVWDRSVEEVEEATADAVAAAELAAEGAGVDVDDAESDVEDAEGDLKDAEDAIGDNRGQIDASFFEGSTHITVDGIVTDVTDVENQHVTMTGAGIDNGVKYQEDVEAGTVAFANANGTLTVDGADLATLNVEGTIKAVDATTAGKLTLAENGTTDVKTLNLNLSNAAVVSTAGLTAVTTVASTGAGNLDLVVGSTVHTVTTAAGNDSVTISFATSSKQGASVSTGAGDDEITVSTTGTGTTTVDAGAGDDVVILTRALGNNDDLDGGEGIDTLSINNTATLSSGNYARLAQVDGFENLRFQNEVELDASQVGNFDELHFESTATVSNAVAEQLLVTSGDTLIVKAAGYAATGADDAAKVVNAGSVSISVVEGSTDVGVYAKSATVNVDTTDAKAGVAAYFGDDNDGDPDVFSIVESLTVNLVSTANAAGDTADVASVDIDAANMGDNFTSLTLEGTGYAYVDNSEGGTLQTVDASGLTSFVVDDDEQSGLNFTGNAGVQEYVTVSAGKDVINISSQIGNSSLNLMDSIEGLEFSFDDEGGLVEGSDIFVLDKTEFADSDFVAFEFETVPSSLVAALNLVAASTDENVVFSFENNTYIFADVGAVTDGDFEAADMLVQLVGSYDLADVAAMANGLA